MVAESQATGAGITGVPGDVFVFQRPSQDTNSSQQACERAQQAAKKHQAAAAAALTQADAKSGAEEWLLDLPSAPIKASMPRLAYQGGVNDECVKGKPMDIEFAAVRASWYPTSGVVLPTISAAARALRFQTAASQSWRAKRPHALRGEGEDENDDEVIISDRLGKLLAPKAKKMGPPKPWEPSRHGHRV